MRTELHRVLQVTIAAPLTNYMSTLQSQYARCITGGCRSCGANSKWSAARRRSGGTTPRGQMRQLQLQLRLQPQIQLQLNCCQLQTCQRLQQRGQAALRWQQRQRRGLGH